MRLPENKRPFRFLIGMLVVALTGASGCRSIPILSSKPAVEATRLPDQPVVVPARRVGDLLLVEMQWDKRGPWRFIVDTGSSVTLVSPEFASRYSLSRRRFVNAPKRVRLSTGAERLFPGTVIRSFELGNAVFENKPVLILDPSDLSAQFGVKIDGILGFPFFSGTRFELDYGRPQIRIQKSDTTSPRPADAIPFRLETGTPRVPISLEGGAREALVDSGSDAEVSLPAGSATPAWRVPPRSGGSFGAIGDSAPTEVARMEGTLVIGPHTIPQPVVTLGSADLSIGGALLGHFVVTCDTAAGWLTLAPLPEATFQPTPFRHAGMSFAKTPAYWRIDAIIPGSAAEAAGIRKGDLVVRINGEPVNQWPLARFDAHVRRGGDLTYTFLHGLREKPVVIPTMELVPR